MAFDATRNALLIGMRKQLLFTFLAEAKAVDFTFAVQRSRSVEFVVKPEVGVARLERKPPEAK
jgi:hypothetical protein